MSKSITRNHSAVHSANRLSLELYRKLGLDGGITLNPLQRMKAYTQHYDEALKRELLTHEETEDMWLRFFADSGVRQIQKTRGSARGFYRELMSGWRPARRTCPWLEAGLYVDRHGDATACCMVKDTSRYSLGRVGTDEPARILDRREQMRRQLAAGETPEACAGCELAGAALMSRGQLIRFGLKGVWNRWFLPARQAHSDPLVQPR